MPVIASPGHPSEPRLCPAIGSRLEALGYRISAVECSPRTVTSSAMTVPISDNNGRVALITCEWQFQLLWRTGGTPGSGRESSCRRQPVQQRVRDVEPGLAQAIDNAHLVRMAERSPTHEINHRFRGTWRRRELERIADPLSDRRLRHGGELVMNLRPARVIILSRVPNSRKDKKTQCPPTKTN